MTKIILFTMKACAVLLFAFIAVYMLFYIIVTQIGIKNKADTLIGIFVLDLERTNLGIYSDNVDNYKDLTIEFKKDKTFKLNKSVPFIEDTMGTWKVGRAGKLNYIYGDYFIKKYGKEAPGTPITEGYIDKGDYIVCIYSVTPRADQLRKSNVYEVYFRKLDTHANPTVKPQKR